MLTEHKPHIRRKRAQMLSELKTRPLVMRKTHTHTHTHTHLNFLLNSLFWYFYILILSIFIMFFFSHPWLVLQLTGRCNCSLSLLILVVRTRIQLNHRHRNWVKTLEEEVKRKQKEEMGGKIKMLLHNADVYNHKLQETAETLKTKWMSKPWTARFNVNAVSRPNKLRQP